MDPQWAPSRLTLEKIRGKIFLILWNCQKKELAVSELFNDLACRLRLPRDDTRPFEQQIWEMVSDCICAGRLRQQFEIVENSDAMFWPTLAVGGRHEPRGPQPWCTERRNATS